ncbi:MAG: MATE family efflux transporter [Ruminococcaceae bacterium]|nr:MATE family efflux transporter [Oscillospiraceae bacterium]
MSRSMTSGSPSKALLLFAIPLILGNIFQQAYSLADSIIVGNFVGANALAAVGTTASLTFLFIAVATGTGIGSGVLISQLFGAKEFGRMKTTIYTSLISIFAISVILTILGLILCRPILVLMQTPENIMNDAEDYLNIYFLGMVFLFMYNIVNSIFNALGESKKTLFFLIIASILNIFLDLLFVVKFNMGVRGVAIATLISQVLCSLISFLFLLAKLRQFKEFKDFSYFDIQTLSSVAKLAIPSVIQQSTVSIGLILVQSLVNSYGSVVVAGYTAATKIDGVAIMPMVNVGNAMSTFAAQHIGAKKQERIPKGLRTSFIMACSIGLLIAGIVYLSGESLVALFMDSSANVDSIKIGVEYLRVVSISYFIMGLLNVTNGTIRGGGDMKNFMLITFLNHLVRVSFAYIFSFIFGYSAIWWGLPAGWTVSFIFSYIVYKKGNWLKKSIY